MEHKRSKWWKSPAAGGVALAIIVQFGIAPHISTDWLDLIVPPAQAKGATPPPPTYVPSLAPASNKPCMVLVGNTLINVNHIVAVSYDKDDKVLYIERGGRGNYTRMMVNPGYTPTQAITEFHTWVKQQCEAQK